MENNNQDDLNCPICHETYNKPNNEPVHLRCGHDICRHCLKDLYDRKGITFPCPLCRFNHDGTPPNKMFTNYTLLGHAESSTSLNEAYKNTESCQTGNYLFSYPVNIPSRRGSILSDFGTPSSISSSPTPMPLFPVLYHSGIYPTSIPVNIPFRHRSQSLDFGTPSSISSFHKPRENTQEQHMFPCDLSGTSSAQQCFSGPSYSPSLISPRNSQEVYVNNFGTPNCNSKNIPSAPPMDIANDKFTKASAKDYPIQHDYNKITTCNIKETTDKISTNPIKEGPKKQKKSRVILEKIIEAVALVLD